MTDSSSDKQMIEKWMKWGELALESKKYQEAHEYFTQVLVEEPENWMAVFLRGKAAALQTTFKESKIDELTTAVNDAIEILSRLDKNSENETNIRKMFAQEMYEFVNNYSQSVEKTFADKIKRNAADLSVIGFSKYRDQAYENLEIALKLIQDIHDDEAITLRTNIKKALVWIYHYRCKSERYEVAILPNQPKATVSSGAYLKEKKKWIDRHDELLLEIRITDPDFKKSYGKNKWAIDRLEYPDDFEKENLDNRQSRLENLQNEIDKQNQVNEVEYRRKYWEANPEEYQWFKDEQRRKEEQRERQRTEIKGKISILEEKFKINNHEADNLRNERENLGPLAFKKKKEIDANIEKIVGSNVKVKKEIEELSQQLKNY